MFDLRKIDCLCQSGLPMDAPASGCWIGVRISSDLHAHLAAFAALALGGTLKGATGMGAPLIAIPVMTALFDVRLAVVVMLLPNLYTTLWQLLFFRAHRPGPLP
jgi:hypothetical protein